MVQNANYMEQILRRDFSIADEYSIRIETGEIPLTNTIVLKGLIERVRDDIDILDVETGKKLNEKNQKLIRINQEKKQQIDQSIQNLDEDSIDENSIKYAKLNQDFKRYKKELSIIKEIGYRKGWME